jgi:hypothetical protein
MISHESLFIFLPARVIAANTKPMRKNECIVIGWCCGVLVSWCALIGIKLKLRISDGMSEEKGNPKKVYYMRIIRAIASRVAGRR